MLKRVFGPRARGPGRGNLLPRTRSWSGALIFASDRFHRGESGSPDLSRPKFTSQKRTQKRTEAFSFLLRPAIVRGVAPNAADLPPHHIQDAAALHHGLRRICLNIFKPAPKACLATEHEMTIYRGRLARLAVHLPAPSLKSAWRRRAPRRRDFRWEHLAN